MRVRGWESILHAELQAAKDRPFIWGEHDCVTWVANVILALTGTDYMAEFRGTYDSQLGARRLIKEIGGDLPGCVDGKLPSIPVPMARRGDVVLYENALGICCGVKSFFITQADGLQGIRTLQCEKAWRVE